MTEYKNFDSGSSLALLNRILDQTDEIALEYFRQARGSIGETQKDDGSYVTRADKEVERVIRNEIGKVYPGHAVIGEEEGESPGADGDFCWVIDPIDGTHGFMTGLPIWATLIALRFDNEILLSVISAPAFRTRWWAIKGEGAYKSDVDNEALRLRTSEVKNFNEAQLLFTGTKACEEKWQKFRDLQAGVWRERGVGDFWGHCLVAEGASEIMLDPIVSIWDVAALFLLVHEAGGKMTDELGNEIYTAGHAVSSNGLIHGEVIEFLNK